MKAKKLKIYVKTDSFSFPIPALRFWILRGLSKFVIKCCQYNRISGRMSQSSGYILKEITAEDIDQIIDKLEQEGPFEMVNVETFDKNEGKVVVKIYTL